jgi:hypothetical protein
MVARIVAEVVRLTHSDCKNPATLRCHHPPPYPRLQLKAKSKNETVISPVATSVV